MQTISDSSLIDKLKKEDNTSFGILYKCFFPSIATHITNNYGNTADAEDIFQESVIILLQKVRQPDFVLIASLKTYLFAVSRNLWLKHLRDNKLLTVADFEKYEQVPEIFSMEIQPVKTIEEKLNSWLSKITANCQRILKAIFFYDQPMDSLMKTLGWKNKHTAANQQYKCIQQVKKQKDKELRG